jgi:hypothetical protein
MELAQDRDRWRALVTTFPKMPGISWLATEPVSFSRMTLLHGESKYYYYYLWEPFGPDRSYLICGRHHTQGLFKTWLAHVACQNNTHVVCISTKLTVLKYSKFMRSISKWKWPIVVGGTEIGAIK